MTQETSNANLLRTGPYRNPRYQEDADRLQAHDDALRDQASKDQDGESETDTARVEPQHNWEKRYKDLQSYNSRKMSEMQAEIDNLKVQGAPKLDVPKTQEDMDLFKQANPDTYAIIETMAHNIAQSQLETYDASLAQVKGDLMETKIERAALAIKAAHPDYETLVESDVFHQWAGAQSEEVQDWIYNNPDDPQKAIRAISLFKYEKGLSQTEIQRTELKGDASLDVNVRGRASMEAVVDRNHPAYVWKESEIAAMRPLEFDKWQENILLARNENRLLIGQ